MLQEPNFIKTRRSALIDLALFFIFTYFIKMLQNFAHFVGQFWIQNHVILDSFKFSVPLDGGRRTEEQQEILVSNIG